MRKIVLNLALSLDGFIEGANGEYDWCFTDQDYGLSEFLEQIDVLLMGRKTYETLRGSGADPFSGKHKYIVSNSLTSTESSETVIAGDFIIAIRRLKEEDGKDIWLFGGAQLTDALLKEKIVDEFQLSFHPLLLGSGTRLFRKLDSRLRLELANCKQYDSGLVQLVYRPKY
jgi:dihydrofolate reductase